MAKTKKNRKGGAQHLVHYVTVCTTTSVFDFQVTGAQLGLEPRPARVTSVDLSVSTSAPGQFLTVQVWTPVPGEAATRGPTKLIPVGPVTHYRLRVPSTTDFGYIFNQNVFGLSGGNCSKDAPSTITTNIVGKVTVLYKDAQPMSIRQLHYDGTLTSFGRDDDDNSSSGGFEQV